LTIFLTPATPLALAADVDLEPSAETAVFFDVVPLARPLTVVGDLPPGFPEDDDTPLTDFVDAFELVRDRSLLLDDTELVGDRLTEAPPAAVLLIPLDGSFALN